MASIKNESDYEDDEVFQETEDKSDVDYEEDEEKEEEEKEHNSQTEKKPKEKPVKKEKQTPDAPELRLADDEDGEVYYVEAQRTRGRGRPRLGKRRKMDDEGDPNNKYRNILTDEDGNPIKIKDDEVITPEDPKGETKVNKMGQLLGGRQYKCRIFKVPQRGQKYYMIATEAARLVGYRDSYFLFQKHKRLFKITLGDTEKLDLIANGVLPNSYKTRTIFLVTARSIFKEFGAKIVVNGKQVDDDYYEQKAIESGAQRGAPAVITFDYYNENNDQKRVAMLTPGITGFERAFVQASNPHMTWIYDQALSVRKFDAELLNDRLEILKSKFMRDPYTGVNHVPDIMQPTTCSIQKLHDSRKLKFDIVIQDKGVIKTGLEDVPLEIFDGVVDEETKQAILKQQELERA
ncbi:hypothetical protein KL918_001044 [Ogataea parapolymorpha]|uniref:Chromatin structure-remodeling complex subunit RSC7 n=1 Tax=Ogataea parapolymorpha (strain ATCC 26012 / BCRC 20466 / JCM 22074 / NRRL Y-7560 / DL-1) TaxID=871575 RepID=W1Q9E3_OGAPD|nr:hypothetical protein HPODL_01530 [Ogataea parapolymorpha DL-1]ESW97431.1 hypothetical protein HPODL_01530 [Ogataea parapolymorpha DL-1]KAG7869499.1 hypothetical protein KL918_001044 [Ogataea parapolymorpha]KAG7875448.1 hypothetical protein KL916_000119 [Ogataea parapolymorpha]